MMKLVADTKAEEKKVNRLSKTHRKTRKTFVNMLRVSLESFAVNMSYMSAQSETFAGCSIKLSELRDKDLSSSHEQLEAQLTEVC